MAAKDSLLLAQFEAAARRDFERRLAEQISTARRLLENAEVGPCFRALLETDGDQRWMLLNQLVRNTSGPQTIQGMEAATSFVVTYLLDDGECVTAPVRSATHLGPDDHTSQIRFQTLAPLEEPNARRARAADVLRALRANEEAELQRQRLYEDFDSEDPS